MMAGVQIYNCLGAMCQPRVLGCSYTNLLLREKAVLCDVLLEVSNGIGCPESGIYLEIGLQRIRRFFKFDPPGGIKSVTLLSCETDPQRPPSGSTSVSAKPRISEPYFVSSALYLA